MTAKRNPAPLAGGGRASDTVLGIWDGAQDSFPRDLPQAVRSNPGHNGDPRAATGSPVPQPSGGGMSAESRLALISSRNAETFGADPRKVRVEALRAAGHEKSPLTSVIRAKCLDCCGGQPSEVRMCVAVDCPLWPYRMGNNPFTGRRGNVAALRPSGPEATEASAPIGPERQDRGAGLLDRDGNGGGDG